MPVNTTDASTISKGDLSKILAPALVSLDGIGRTFALQKISCVINASTYQTLRDISNVFRAVTRAAAP
jgi:hypothetical protein